MNQKPLLQVEDIQTCFFHQGKAIRAVDGMSYSLNKGETVALVGESGCGKTVSALSVLRLLPKYSAKVVRGRVIFKGENILSYSPAALQKIRGNQISMIFQEPMTSLNPVFSIGNQIMETIRFHQRVSKKESSERCIELLDMVGFPFPKKRLEDYPHQLSGGLRQRVMIAIALSCDPEIVIADEPTTALDVTVQAQIIALLMHLQKKFGMSMIFISHDLAVVSAIAERIIVMYAGLIVEEGKTKDVFKQPHHPYTKGLLKSVLSLKETEEGKLYEIPGSIPDLSDLPPGCTFNPRCRYAAEVCRAEEPLLKRVGEAHCSRCVLE